MKAIIFQCPPRAQFHFGKVALDVDTSLDDTSVIIHSDTLFSALVSTAEQLWGAGDEFVKYFSDKGLRISSAFHCWERANGEHIYFLPKPAHFNQLGDPKDNDERKRQAKVKFISKKIWEMGLGPKEWQEHGCLIIDDVVVMHPSELPEWTAEQISTMQLFKTFSLPKVSIHKPSKEDSIYFQTNLELSTNFHLINHQKNDVEEQVMKLPKCHYYFLMDTGDLTKDELTRLNTAIAVLADTGIGGERSVGCGRLTGASQHDFEFDLESNSLWCSLSLLNPLPADMTKLKSWQVVTRGGRRVSREQVTDPAKLNGEDPKLKRVKMLAEGALLTNDLIGQVVDVSVPHGGSNHRRNGICLCIPVHPNVHPK